MQAPEPHHASATAPTQPDEANKRTFIHVGFPKSASTYLQRKVFPAMGNLADLTKLEKDDKWRLLQGQMQPAPFRELVNQLIGAPQADRDYRIISYEGLVGHPFRAFSSLYWQVRQRKGWHVDQSAWDPRHVVDLLKGAYPDARIIMIIREQFAWAVSHYKMYWSRGHTSAAIEPLLDDYADPYEQQIQRYMDAFGSDRVLVLPYELLCADTSSFVRSVSRFIDPGFEPKVSEDRVNAAPPLLRDAYYGRAKSILKMNMRRQGQPRSLAQRIAFRASRAWINTGRYTWYAMQHGKQKFKVDVDEQTRRKLRPTLAASNRRVQELTGLDLTPYGYVLDADRDTNPVNNDRADR